MFTFKNTPNHFGLVAILLHWSMAILIIGLLALGLYMTRMPISLEKLKYFGWHKEWGMLALILVVVRLTWRLNNINPSLKALPWIERIAARSVHIAFYIFMFSIPVSGWLITSAAGLPVSFFDWFLFPNLISPSEENLIFFEKVHEWLSYALILTICLHMAAAFKHYLINKDDIMQRMF